MANSVSTSAPKRRSTLKSPSPARPAAAPTNGHGSYIRCWATDPMDSTPLKEIPAPSMPGTLLPTAIVVDAKPSPQVYAPGTPEFRYWVAADVLRRAAKFWTSVGVTHWNASFQKMLPVRLDAGVDLNAYYARNDYSPSMLKGLSFFHDSVYDARTGQSVTVYSGESPDIVAHELGHAILDAIKPELWGIMTTEAAAFHESFGDMSSILTALQTEAICQQVLGETQNQLQRTSSVSRLAEQLGYAIRQEHPNDVDQDSLRNASNNFAYADPTTLPSTGPAASLTSAPHNFSRVFTGAFLDALGRMLLTLSATPKVADVQRVSSDMGKLLVKAIQQAPLRTHFFQAVAEQLLLADKQLFNSLYSKAMATAFTRRGLLPLHALAAMEDGAAPLGTGAFAAHISAIAAGGVDGAGNTTPDALQPVSLTLAGLPMGLPVDNLVVEAPAIDDTPPPGRLGFVGEPASDRQLAVQSFIISLVRRGRIALNDNATSAPAGAMSLMAATTTSKHVTHELVRVGGTVELRRIAIDCHCGCHQA